MGMACAFVIPAINPKAPATNQLFNISVLPLSDLVATGRHDGRVTDRHVVVSGRATVPSSGRSAPTRENGAANLNRRRIKYSSA
jgi:hypothetical protein